jgi:hypothetical protein
MEMEMGNGTGNGTEMGNGKWDSLTRPDLILPFLKPGNGNGTA